MTDAANSPKAVPPQSGVAIESVLGVREKTLLQTLFASQAFWVTVALAGICVIMSIREPRFHSEENFYNITRNFAFIGIMALGLTAVIITGGIDLSVGSIMGLVAVACGLTLEAGHAWYLAVAAGLAAGAIAGAVNGFLISYVGLSSFVVTLGMLSAARSVAVVLSGNRMIYNFGPGGPGFKIIGSGSFLGIANPVWVLVVLTITFAIVLKMTTWGRHLM